MVSKDGLSSQCLYVCTMNETMNEPMSWRVTIAFKLCLPARQSYHKHFYFIIPFSSFSIFATQDNLLSSWKRSSVFTGIRSRPFSPSTLFILTLSISLALGVFNTHCCSLGVFTHGSGKSKDSLDLTLSLLSRCKELRLKSRGGTMCSRGVWPNSKISPTDDIMGVVNPLE